MAIRLLVSFPLNTARARYREARGGPCLAFSVQRLAFSFSRYSEIRVQIAAGTKFGPYVIVAPLGSGGMADVYRARDPRLGREVALKILPTRLITDEGSMERFRREVRAVAALSHPNIIHIYDFGLEEGRPFAVTELLEGQTLRERMRHSPPTLEESIEIAASICDGIEAAHSKKIIHRDLKPENIFLTADGRVKILDFGIARSEQPLVQADGTRSTPTVLTETGMIVGTVGYLSPEQVRGEKAGVESDIFAIGCLLYEMIAQRNPFERDVPIDSVVAVLRDEPPPLQEFAPFMPRALEELVEQCLEKERELRPTSAHDVATSLRMIEATLSPKSRSSRARKITLPALPTAPRRRMRRRRYGLPIVLILLALLGVAGFFVFQQRRVDAGYDLRYGDLSGTFETKRLIALAFSADASGNRPEAAELARQSLRRGDPSPVTPALLASFDRAQNNTAAAARWAALAEPHMKGSSTYEGILARYLMSKGDREELALANSLLALRPRAWRARLAVAHLLLGQRELPAVVAQLKLIDIDAPDDRRLVTVLSDRGSLGDAVAAKHDLERSALTSKPALYFHTAGRLAWSEGDAKRARSSFDQSAAKASAENLPGVATDSRYLAAIAALGIGDLEDAQRRFDECANKSHELEDQSHDFWSTALGAYVAYRRGDEAGRDLRFQRLVTIPDPGFPETVQMRLMMAWMHSKVAVAPLKIAPREHADYGGSDTLLDARLAFERGDLANARILLDRAAAEGAEGSWFREEAMLLRHQLGQPSKLERPDPPYPNGARLPAIWELQRLVRSGVPQAVSAWPSRQ